MKPRKKLVKKKEISRRKKYNPENLQKALAAIQEGMSKKLAAKTFEVPRATLQFRCKHPDKVDPRPGPATVLSKEEEENLVKWIIISSKKGFPKRKEDIQYSVSKFLEDTKRSNPFKGNVPGEKWMKLFLKRHPEISIRTSEAVTAASANVAEKDIKGWFYKIEEYLKQNGLFDVLSDPNRVFNGDETNFLLCPKTGTVLAEKGEKNVYEIDRGLAKSAITVMFTFAASGALTPPMIIFPYKRLPTDIAAKVPDKWGIGLSDNGWMKADVFYDYVKNVLYPHLIEVNVKFPIIFFVDGHKTHMTLQVSELCSELGIVLIALYPNSTRILQPADVAAFFPLKCAYRKSVLNWRRDHPSQALTKLEFVPILQNAINLGIKPDTIKNGFKTCGLYPWDPTSINYSKCLGSSSTATKDTTKNEIESIPEKTITKEIFTNIVGLDIIKGLEQKSQKTHCETILRNLWNFFKTSGDQEEQVNLISTEYSSQYIDIDPNIRIEDLDVIIANDNLNMSLSQDSNIAEKFLANVGGNAIIDANIIPEIQENTQKADKKIVVSSIVCNPRNKEILTVQTEKNRTENKVQKKNIDLTPVQLQDLLVVPKTPIRKGNRDTERTSFVLTSAEWQSKENEKLRIKQEKDDAIKKRREERELKKALPKTKQVKKEQVKKEKKEPVKQEKKEQGKKEKNSKLVTENPQTQKITMIKKQLFSPDFYNIASTSKETNSFDNSLKIIDLNLNVNVKKDTKKYTEVEIEKMLTEFED